jgi:hypothetical protein
MSLFTSLFDCRWIAQPWLLVAALAATAAAEPRLKVSDNRRFLTYADDRPFFYLGDTAWELFHRLDRDEAERYLADRASKRFTVIQAVALAELDGLNTPNAYGHRPLIDNDPARPDVKDGPENDYWDHVDFIVGRAAQHGLFIGLLPTWGDKWNRKGGAGPEVFRPENARKYAQWLGERSRGQPIIWILGGDRAIENDAHRAIVAAMAEGLRAGDGGEHLITFHPPGGAGSADWFHDQPWLDFNMRQNGHVLEFPERYSQTRVNYDREPTKPVIDGEPIYEDHPVSFNAKSLGHSTAADVRRPLYWDLFSGAFGHTYGHHSVWQMWTPDRNPVNNPLMPWFEAISQPGAAQMQYGRRLIESRPFLTRIPDDSLIVVDRVPTSVPGSGTRRFVGTRDESGTYAMIYAPIGRSFEVDLGKLNAQRIKAWWFNPRDGRATPAGEYENAGEQAFTPPDAGELLDWVLVLDDAAKNYPAPGTEVYRP